MSVSLHRTAGQVLKHSPRHGSTIPEVETIMNNFGDSISAPAAPAVSVDMGARLLVVDPLIAVLEALDPVISILNTVSAALGNPKLLDEFGVDPIREVIEFTTLRLRHARNEVGTKIDTICAG